MIEVVKVSRKDTFHKILTYLITSVWLVNGLFCKVLNLVPRHQLIVARILGNEYAGVLTKTIGIAETMMAIWIISGVKYRWCAITQMALVASMNIIEFFLAPDLLLFGKLSAFFALLLILIIYCHAFLIHKKRVRSF